MLGVYKVAVETTNQYTCSGVKGKGTVFNFLFFLGVPGAFFGVLLALGACMMRGWGWGGGGGMVMCRSWVIYISRRSALTSARPEHVTNSARLS